MVALNFDANTVEPNGPYEVIPAGDYTAQIVASEMQDTKDRTGQFLKLELEILEGQQAGRKLFDRLNLVNRNAQAQEIAQRTLSAICHAVGKLTVQDSDELHGLPMIVKVKVKERNDRPGELSNEIGGYKKLERVGAATAATRAAAPPPAAPSAPTPSPAKAGGAVPPWKKTAA